MKKSIKIISLIGIGSILVGCANMEQQKKTDNPNELNISSSIKESHVFDTGPLPRSKVFRYQSFASDTNVAYSSLEINLQRTINRITEYQTTEQSGNTVIKGDSIGYGGMAPFTVLKQKTLQDPQQKKTTTISQQNYKVLNIDQVSGKLFPLQVGNQLSYAFKAIFNNNQAKNTLIQGMAKFEVTGKNSNLILNQNPPDANIPLGDVFIITYSEALNNQAWKPRAQYYFSPKLGWFIQVTEYNNEGLPKRIYKLTQALNSLNFMKPPAQ